jgi:hypothetical protein
MVKPKKSFSKKKRPQQAAIRTLLESNVSEEDLVVAEVDAIDSLKTKELASTAANVLNTKSEIKQSKTLPQLEKQVWNGIEKGKEYFLSIGEALAEIQEKKLYKKTTFSTFEDYCQKTFDISRAAAYRFIKGYRTKVSVLSPIGDKSTLPELESESHFRELGKVKGATNQKKILEIFQEQNPESKITAKGLKEVVLKHYEKTSKKVSKKEIKQTMRVNERLRIFSSEDISVEGKTFEVKSKEQDIADFLKRVSEAISAGGSVQIAYKHNNKSNAMTER